jgi:hypothetical protein
MTKTSVSISNAFNRITITRNGSTRVYPSFLPTSGQNRLYDFLNRNAEKFNIQPYTETNNDVTVIATVSKFWTLKGANDAPIR